MSRGAKPLLVPVTPGKARMAPWSPTASREEVRDYLEQRLALFSKLMFWIFWILVIFVVGLYEVYPEHRPERVAIVYNSGIGGLVVLAAIWYFALHKRKCSIETLYWIDVFYIVMIGATFGLIAYFSNDQRANVYSAFIWHTFAVFGRVIVIPSTGLRSAMVTGASFVPLMVAGVFHSIYFPERLELPPLAFLGGTLMFAVVATVLASTGSRVIYGLRKQVSEAKQLGQYTLDEKIGEGGMGAVYRARHAMLRRPTAIKLLPLDKYAADSVKRFEREVQHTSLLTHPNTVAIYDYGRSPDGVFYYAMEYIDGVDLETLVKRYGPQPAARVVHILRQVCGALDEAHDNGLIHRDIKPGNIILCRRGRTPDVVKVVDFGLVKEITPDASESLTKIISGTPAYLAPEAVTDPESMGPLSDVYSLGAVGYFLLTGERVFAGKGSVDLCVQHVSKAPVPPRDRTENHIPVELEKLVLACLAKEARSRPSARELRHALSELSVCREYDEPAAIAWWRELEAEQKQLDSTRTDAAAPSTITVDVRGRTTTDLDRDATLAGLGE